MAGVSFGSVYELKKDKVDSLINFMTEPLSTKEKKNEKDFEKFYKNYKGVETNLSEFDFSA
ncbi:MAG: hypothetical protein LBB10_00865 [Bifidobacteriaceae bacterium]|jgi:hypothetical protein|nr:hypothetical protein [Bifidobacteriaceae bacterium]